MINLGNNEIQEIVNAIDKINSVGDSQRVPIGIKEWFMIFKSPESKEENEIDIVLMNGCASTPFMFFADKNDKNMYVSIKRNAERIVMEYTNSLQSEIESELEPEI